LGLPVLIIGGLRLTVKPQISKDYLLEEYFNKRRSLKSIALENGVSRTKVRNTMSKLGLKPRIMLGSDHHLWKGGPVKYTCKFCGKVFEDHRRTRTYCSKQCHYDAIRAGKSGNWRGGPIEHICEICGEKFLTAPHRVDARFCSSECYYKIPPEQTVNWQDGVSYLPYCHLFNEMKKEEVRNKANRVCQLCGRPEILNGERLSVHHVDGNKMQGCNGRKWVLVAVCRKCHSTAETIENEFLLMTNPP